MSDAYIATFNVPKMDCPSEENLIRLALGDIASGIEVDLTQRQVRISHENCLAAIEAKMQSLNLGASLLENIQTHEQLTLAQDERESSTLLLLMAINGAMFCIEIITGLWAQSAGLIADSLDMFADAAVYGAALYAIGKSAKAKVRVAHFSGWLQILFVVFTLGEVLRRFVYGSAPESTAMIAMGLLAMAANIVCLLLVSKHRDGGAHMKASWIFSANDVIANAGVILAGLLVAWTGSQLPDLVIGTIIAIIVFMGAYRILKLKA